MLSGIGLAPAVAVSTGDSSISGTVALPADAPPEWLESVVVTASQVSGSATGSASVDRASGAYAIVDLPAGSYHVHFMAAGTDLIDEYFDDATDIADAVPVATSAGAPAAGIDAALATGATISGTVALPAGAPSEWLEAIRVTAVPFSGGGAGGAAWLDPETGQYAITGLVPGFYRVIFDGAGVGLVTEYFDDTTDFMSAAAVEARLGAPARGVDASMEIGATISGQVTLAAGTPAGWMDSILVTAEPVAGGGLSAAASVDRDTGQYTVRSLADGAYRVSFTDSGRRLISEYFDDTTDYASAVPVVTSAGAPATGIDAALELGATISGTVSLPAGAPAEWMDDVTVSAYPFRGEAFSSSASVERGTGRYTIGGLVDGDYRVSFTIEGERSRLLSEYFDNTTDYDRAVPVATRLDAPATGIDAGLEAGGIIRGTLRDAAGAPAADVPVVAVDARQGGTPLGSTQTDASGAYVLSHLAAGQYKVLAGNTHVASPYSRTFIGGTSFGAAETIEVLPGEIVADRNAVLMARQVNAPRPGKPVLSATEASGGAAAVSWPAPGSGTAPIAYNASYNNPQWGNGSVHVAMPSNSLELDLRLGSFAVLVTALGASAEGETAAVVVNDPSAPASPSVRVVRTGGTLRVVASSSAPAGAEWWFAHLPHGGGAFDLVTEYTSGTEVTFADVDPRSDGQVFAAWRSGSTISQIATLTSAPETPAGPAVHPWFSAKYSELGGAAGQLGIVKKPMQCQSSSCWQEFEGGVLTSDGREIVKLSTAYVTTWLAKGGPDGALGLVAGPESCFGTYCATPFTHGVIKWTPGVGVTVILVHPWFEAAWKSHGGLAGAIGAPTHEMKCQSSSCWQEFAGGVLTSDGRQIVRLSTAYVATWLSWGGPDGDLGLVAGAESCHGTYCQTAFSGGVIVWVPSSGVFPVAKNWFYPAWMASGGASGSLGLPTDAMRCQSSACYQTFAKGTLTSSTTGIVALSSAYVAEWLTSGGPNGRLGLVASAESCFGTYCQVRFERGLMIWQPSSGVRILTGKDLADWEASQRPPNPGDTMNCSNFSTQREAQAWFDRYFPYYGDIAKLDGNNDGIACESLS